MVRHNVRPTIIVSLLVRKLWVILIFFALDIRTWNQHPFPSFATLERKTVEFDNFTLNKTPMKIETKPAPHLKQLLTIYSK